MADLTATVCTGYWKILEKLGEKMGTAFEKLDTPSVARTGKKFSDLDDNLRQMVFNAFGVFKPLSHSYRVVAKWEGKIYTGHGKWIPDPEELGIGRWLRVRNVRQAQRYGTTVGPQYFFHLIQRYGRSIAPAVRTDARERFAAAVVCAEKLVSYHDIEQQVLVPPTVLVGRRTGLPVTTTSLTLDLSGDQIYAVFDVPDGELSYDRFDIGMLEDRAKSGAHELFRKMRKARLGNVAVLKEMKDVVAPLFLVGTSSGWENLAV